MSDGFMPGFFSGILFVAVIVGLYRIGSWIARHDQPRTIIELLTQPTISIMDAVGFVLLVSLIFGIYLVLGYGPGIARKT